MAYVENIYDPLGKVDPKDKHKAGKKRQALSRGSKSFGSKHQGPPKRAKRVFPLEDLYASLTTDEISKLLSKDCGLSEALLNDLFWEAVWPRLLARGWHSEEVLSRHAASSSSSSSPSHTLIFLKPGVNKFARRKMTSRDQYFASVSDVLRKVAKEPDLLELGPEWTIETLKGFQSAAAISRDEATILGNKRGHNGTAVDQEAPPNANAALVHKTPELKIKFQVQPSQ